MMKTGLIILGAVLLSCSANSAQELRGRICVAPNSSERPQRVSPGQSYNPATLMVKIDKQPPVHWPHKESLEIADLDVRERHLVVLISDGKRIQSLWMRFSDFKTASLCMSFDGYQGVQIDDQQASPWCKCKRATGLKPGPKK